MKDFKVNHGGESYIFNFPTTIKEISPEYLTAITSNIKVAAHHCLIAIVYREAISTVVLTYKQRKKSITAGVVPIFIKAGDTDSEFIKNLAIKDTLVIPGSMLSLANHISIFENTLSLDYFMTLLDSDNEVGQRAIGENQKVCFVDFKIVGNTDIVAAYTQEQRQESPIKYVEKKSAHDNSLTGEVE